MNKKLLQSLQVILSINWIVIPALFVWIAFGVSFWLSLIFLVVWFIADRIWDWISGLLIVGAGAISGQDPLKIELGEVVPVGAALMMILDLVGALTIPWIVAGGFLWF